MTKDEESLNVQATSLPLSWNPFEEDDDAVLSADWMLSLDFSKRVSCGLTTEAVGFLCPNSNSFYFPDSKKTDSLSKPSCMHFMEIFCVWEFRWKGL